MHGWTKRVIEKLHETLFEAAEVFFFPFFLANSMRAITDTQRSWMGMQPVNPLSLDFYFFDPAQATEKQKALKLLKILSKAPSFVRFFWYTYWLYINTAYTSLFLSLFLSLSLLSLSLPLYTTIHISIP